MNPVPRRPSADDGAPPAANQSATRLKSTDDDVVVRPVSAKGLAARVRARFGTFTSWLSSGVKKDYNITKTELGKGKFGVVKLAYHKKTGESRAIKVMEKKDRTEKDLNLMRREVDVMRRIDHPNCIKFFNVYETRDKIFIVMELLWGGQMLDRIVERDHFSEMEAARCFVQIMSGIEYLHHNGVVHRDLKPENIMFANEDEDSILKIVDFGLGRAVEPEELDSGRARFWSRCGSPNYVAPEVLNRRGYGMECDIWSAGVILYITLTGVPPFNQSTVERKFASIKKAEFSFPEQMWAWISEEAKDLLTRMLTLDTNKRLDCTECLNHAWVRKFEAGQLSETAMPPVEARLQHWTPIRKLAAVVLACAILQRVAKAVMKPVSALNAENDANKGPLDSVSMTEMKEAFDLLDRRRRQAVKVKDVLALLRAFGYHAEVGERFLSRHGLSKSGGEISFHKLCHIVFPFSSAETPSRTRSTECEPRDRTPSPEPFAGNGFGRIRSADSRYTTPAYDDSAAAGATPHSPVAAGGGRERGGGGGGGRGGGGGGGGRGRRGGLICGRLWSGVDEEIGDIFETMDIRGVGYVGADALQELFGRFGCAVSNTDAEEMIRIGDQAGDGQIVFSDLVSLVRFEGSTRQRPLKNSEDAQGAQREAPTRCSSK